MNAMLAVLALCLVTPAAYAYIDPGVGSLLVQGLIAAVAAGAAVVRYYWDAIRNFLRTRKLPAGDGSSADRES